MNICRSKIGTVVRGMAPTYFFSANLTNARHAAMRKQPAPNSHLAPCLPGGKCPKGAQGVSRGSKGPQGPPRGPLGPQGPQGGPSDPLGAPWAPRGPKGALGVRRGGPLAARILLISQNAFFFCTDCRECDKRIFFCTDFRGR